MLTVEAIRERARAMQLVPIEAADRAAMAVALVLQGYDPPRAWRMAFWELKDNDGALQMLARHRRQFTSVQAQEA